MKRLEGRVALVTGGASGIGKAIVERLAGEGAAVLVTDIDDEGGRRVAESLAENGSRALFAHLDVTSEQEWQAAVTTAVDQLGGLDVLVNNAGMGDLATIEETSLEDWNRTISIDQTGVFLGMKCAASALAASGHGSVVNISSHLRDERGLRHLPRVPRCEGRGAHVDEERGAALGRPGRPR